jgi:hypothetical protein
MYVRPLAIKHAIAQQSYARVLDHPATHLAIPVGKPMQKTCMQETDTRSFCEIALKIIQCIICRIETGIIRACTKAKSTGLTLEGVQ